MCILFITSSVPNPQKHAFGHLISLTRVGTAPPDLVVPLFGTFLTHSCSILCHFCVTFVTLKSAHLNSNSIGI